MLRHNTLLLSCGTNESRSSLGTLFEQSYTLLEASSLEQTAQLLEVSHAYIAAVLLDVSEFGPSELERLGQILQHQKVANIPFVALTSKPGERVCGQIMELGAADMVILPCYPALLQRRVQMVIDLNIHKTHLEELEEEIGAHFRSSNEQVVDVLANALEHQSVEVGQHLLRIRLLTKTLLQKVACCCPEYHLDDHKIQLMSSASALHDIGKIAIPTSIIKKPGPLTPRERTQVQRHCEAGCRLLDRLRENNDQDYFKYAYHICRYHHERWDGGGYPDRLVGDDIPICAQVVGLTDAYDALTTKQVYRGAYSFDQAANMILNGECGRFSTKLLECFKQVLEDFIKIEQMYADHGTVVSVVPSRPVQVNQDEEDSLALAHTKYKAILQHMNAAVFEIDLGQSTYHVVYNPDPNLLVLNSIHSYQSMIEYVADTMVVPEDKETFFAAFQQKIPELFAHKLRRTYTCIHLRNLTGGEPIPYQLTMLRIGTTNSSRKRVSIVWQELDDSSARIKTAQPASDFWSSAISDTLDRLYSVRNDDTLTLNRSSKDILSLLGYTPDELQTQYHNHMIELIHPDDRQDTLSSIQEQLGTQNGFVVEFRVLHSNGHYIWVLNQGQLFCEPDGQEYLYSLLIDISKSKAAEELLQQTLERQAIILQQTENVIFEYDLSTKEATFSPRWKEIFGYAPIIHDVESHVLTESHLHPGDMPLVVSVFHALLNGSSYQEFDLRVARLDGQYLWCRARITTQYDRHGTPIRLVGIIINIDAQKRAAKTLQERAERDPLTGLLNKGAGTSYVEDFLAHTQHNISSAFIIIDLDNFKQVNDIYGHLMGDIIITQAATEIKRMFRSDDIVARIGGDEFMVFMKQLPDANILEDRLKELIQVFRTVLHERVPDANLGCSIGAALFPIHGDSFQDLFSHADLALYQVKTQGKNNCLIYDKNDPIVQGPRKTVPLRLSPIDSVKDDLSSNTNLLQYAFQQLYETEDIEAVIQNMLSLVGQRINASRTYIFENNADNTCCSNTFEWCNTGIRPERHNLQNISYITDAPDYEKNFNEHGIFYCPDISVLPKEYYDLLAPQGVKSMLQCAIREYGVFRGYIGFDECTVPRVWTQDRIDILTFFSEMVSTFLLKKRAHDKAALNAQNLHSILENYHAWIYVVDSKSYQILFVNKHTRAVIPEASEGLYCYQCLRGLDAPCPDCPTHKIGKDKHCEQLVYNEPLDAYILAQATLIQWNGHDAYLMTCYETKPPNL